jgi:hypothetical protein
MQPGRQSSVPLQVAAIVLGVKDLVRAKKLYGEGLSCTIDQDHLNLVSFDLSEGILAASPLPREAAVQDAGVSLRGSGFRGVSFHFMVASSEAVDEVVVNAVAAGRRRREGSSSLPVEWVLGVLQRPRRLLLKVASPS